MQIEEEDLKLKKDIAVAAAKPKYYIDKYEKLESEGSSTFETASYSSEPEQKDIIMFNKETHVVQLKPTAQSFEPKTSTFDDRVLTVQV